MSDTEQPKPQNLAEHAKPQPTPVPEIGGAKRANEPTRFGDWEVAGKCVDF